MIIPTKTALGHEELKSRAHRLGPRYRTILVLVDGRRALSEVLGLAQQAGATAAQLDELVRLGFIDVSPEPAAASPPVAERPGAAATSTTPATQDVRPHDARAAAPDVDAALPLEGTPVRGDDAPRVAEEGAQPHETLLPPSRAPSSAREPADPMPPAPSSAREGAQPPGADAEPSPRTPASPRGDSSVPGAEAPPRTPASLREKANAPGEQAAPRAPPSLREEATDPGQQDVPRTPPSLREEANEPSEAAPVLLHEEANAPSEQGASGTPALLRDEANEPSEEPASGTPALLREESSVPGEGAATSTPALLREEASVPSEQAASRAPASLREAAAALPEPLVPARADAAAPRDPPGPRAVPREIPVLGDEVAVDPLQQIRDLLVDTLRFDAPLFSARMFMRVRNAQTAKDLIDLVWEIQDHLGRGHHAPREMRSLQRARDLLGLGNTLVAEDTSRTPLDD